MRNKINFVALGIQYGNDISTQRRYHDCQYQHPHRHHIPSSSSSLPPLPTLPMSHRCNHCHRAIVVLVVAAPVVIVDTSLCCYAAVLSLLSLHHDHASSSAVSMPSLSSHCHHLTRPLPLHTAICYCSVCPPSVGLVSGLERVPGSLATHALRS